MRLAILSLGFSACTARVAPGAASAVMAVPGDAPRGGALYARDCTGCHGVDGRKMHNASLPEAVARGSDADLVDAILAGPGFMPSYAERLSPAEIADLLAWLHAGLSTP